MREAALVPLPAIAGSEEAAPGDSGLLAREVVASAVGVAVARLGVVRLAAGLVVAVLGVGAAAVGRPLVARARLGGEVLEVCSLDQPLAPLEGAFERGAENPSDELPNQGANPTCGKTRALHSARRRETGMAAVGGGGAVRTTLCERVRCVTSCCTKEHPSARAEWP